MNKSHTLLTEQLKIGLRADLRAIMEGQDLPDLDRGSRRKTESEHRGSIRAQNDSRRLFRVSRAVALRRAGRLWKEVEVAEGPGTLQLCAQYARGLGMSLSDFIEKWEPVS